MLIPETECYYTPACPDVTCVELIQFYLEHSWVRSSTILYIRNRVPEDEAVFNKYASIGQQFNNARIIVMKSKQSASQ